MTAQDAALLASLTGFTPGPWRVRPDPEHGMPTLSLSSGGYDIATLWHGYLAADSDAALIAASPDLHRIATEQAAEIELLREALERIECIGFGATPPSEEVILARRIARAALAVQP